MSTPTLLTPYSIPFFRAFFNRTLIEDEEALDRSAPPEYWAHALSRRDYEKFCSDPAKLLPWLTRQEKNT